MGLACLATISYSHHAAARENGGGVIFVADVSEAADAQVIDIRDIKSCTEASLPGARCLPSSNFIDPDGRVIGFHALRWLLGTVGLSGGETVLVIGTSPQDAKTIGTLLGLAGQHNVQVVDMPFTAPAGATGGEPRSLSREVVFTAPMRDTVTRLPIR